MKRFLYLFVLINFFCSVLLASDDVVDDVDEVQSSYVLRPFLGCGWIDYPSIGVCNGFEEGLVFGYKFEKPFFIGPGIMFQESVDMWSSFCSLSLSFYLSSRWTPIRRKFSPIVEFNVGYISSFRGYESRSYPQKIGADGVYYWEEHHVNDSFDGFFFNPSLGLQIKKVDILFSWNILQCKEENNVYNSRAKTSYKLPVEKGFEHGFTLRFAYNIGF